LLALWHANGFVGCLAAHWPHYQWVTTTWLKQLKFNQWMNKHFTNYNCLVIWSSSRWHASSSTGIPTVNFVMLTCFFPFYLVGSFLNFLEDCLVSKKASIKK